MKKGYVAIVLFALFVVLASSYESLTAVDEAAHNAFFGNEFLQLFTWFGNTSTVMVSGAAMLIWQLAVRQWRGALFVLAGVVGTTLINQAFKRLFERPRPEMVGQLESFSFPSGHAMMSVGYIIVLLYFMMQYVSNRAGQRILYSLGFVLLACVGLSRIAHGYHYFTDVLAGWSLAGAWMIGLIMMYERGMKKKEV